MLSGIRVRGFFAHYDYNNIFAAFSTPLNLYDGHMFFFALTGFSF
jgi:hypothetical protein